MKICSFITLYNPCVEKLIENINEIQKYSDKVYLLLNSSENQLLSELENEKIKIIVNGKNIGLSAAFNKGFVLARNEGYDMAILFDQDSFLKEADFKIMLSTYEKENVDKKIMCIGPSLSVYGNKLSTPKWMLCRRKEKIQNADIVKNIITSGMLLNLSYAYEVGDFDENYPVDFCDYVFCWKAIYNDFFILKSKEAEIVHEIGNSQMKIGNHTIHFHSPYRNYFMVRDTLNICFRLKETPAYIRFRYFLFLLPRVILFLLKCDNKKDRLKMYKIGFSDFIRKKRGFGSISKLLNAE